MARQQQDVDELFEIRNYYYIGNYQQCINEAHKLRKPSTPEIGVQRDIFAYRAYIAQNKYLVVVDEIKNTSDERVLPLKSLAMYLSHKDKRDAIREEVEQMLSGNINVGNDTLLIVAATIYLAEGNKEAAYRLLCSSDSLECMALSLDILLKINRLDLARKKLKEMQDADDDATLTQLAQAWVGLASGGEKLRDAYYIFAELNDKYSAATSGGASTPLLLNGQAVALLGQAKYDEAEEILQTALDRDPNHPDTLVNLTVLAGHHGKDSEGSNNRYLSQLKDSHAEHPFIQDLKLKESEFERICGQFGPSNTIPV